MSMLSRDLVIALSRARSAIPTNVWRELTAEMARESESDVCASALTLLTGRLAPDAAWVLTKAWRESDGLTCRDVAVAMTTVDCLAPAGAPLTEIVWSGPPNGRFPVRRIDQMLYDMIAHGKRRVLLITFAAHRVAHLSQHLKNAITRGVELTLIFESEAESEGQLARDALTAFHDLPLGTVRVFCWPLSQRERNQAGRPGKLHVKCAVVDEVALIGSANLTDDAFNRNMELGVLIRDEQTVSAIAAHFGELINGGLLKQIK